MTNLSWLIPLGIWLVFLFLVVPFNLAGKYKRKYLDVNNQLLELQKPDKNLAIRNQLGIYLMETIQLQVKCLDESTPLAYEEVADWHNKIGLYIGENVGQDYEASFRSTEGLFTIQVGNDIKSEIHRNCMRLVCKDAVAIQELLAELRNK